MQLKEAQLLGILAVLAAGIILVCMWTGSERRDEPGSAQVGGEDSGSPEVADLRELWKSIKQTQPSRTGPKDTKGVAAQKDEDAEQKDRQINDTLDGTDPKDVPLFKDQGPEDLGKQPEPVIHVVQKGDTLSGISRKYYNTSTEWKIIQEANKDLVKDPARDLRPGMKLVIPFREGLQQTASRKPDDPVKRLAIRGPGAGTRIYEAQKGDTLWAIAQENYQDSMAWKDILEANSDILKRAENLRPGMKLILP